MTSARGLRRLAQASPSYRWYALSVATLSQAAVAAVVFTVGPLAPFILADFHISRGQLGLTTSAIYLSSSVVAIFGGRASDRVGERRMLLVSGLIVGVAALLAMRSGSFVLLLAACFVVGIGNGFQNPAGSAAIMRWFDRRLRGLAMGLRQTGVPLGSLLAAGAWPAIAVGLGWRSAYLAGGLVMLAVTAVLLLAYYDPPQEPAAAAAPMAPLSELLANRKLLRLGAVFLTQMAAQQASATYLVLFLTETFKLPLAPAAGLLGAVNFVAMASRIGWGGLSDRAFGGRRKPAVWIILGLSLCCMLLAALMPSHAPLLLAVLLALLLGLSVFAWTGVLGAMVVESAGPRSAGSAMALAMALSGPGSLFGPPLFGFVADRFGGYRSAWLLLAVIVALGIVAFKGFREMEPAAA